jgi:hypothetical protein
MQILDLKGGTTRKEQNHLLDIFVSVTSTMDDLSESSFLSSLEMDQSGSPQGVLTHASAADRALLSPSISGTNLSGMGDGGFGGGDGGEKKPAFFSLMRSLTSRRDSGFS